MGSNIIAASPSVSVSLSPCLRRRRWRWDRRCPSTSRHVATSSSDTVLPDRAPFYFSSPRSTLSNRGFSSPVPTFREALVRVPTESPCSQPPMLRPPPLLISLRSASDLRSVLSICPCDHPLICLLTLGSQFSDLFASLWLLRIAFEFEILQNSFMVWIRLVFCRYW